MRSHVHIHAADVVTEGLGDCGEVFLCLSYGCPAGVGLKDCKETTRHVAIKDDQLMKGLQDR